MGMPLSPFRPIRPLLYSFLLGIFGHSCVPKFTFDLRLLCIPFALITIIFFFRIQQRICIILLLFLLGIWRFQLAAPNLPTTLQPFVAGNWHIVNQDAHPASHFDPRHYTNALRSHFKTRAAQLLPAKQANLLNGMIWGAPLDDFTLKRQFRQAGLSHLTAVSGGNLTYLALALAPICAALRLRQRHRILLQIILVTAFVLFVGPGTSVIRAACMISLLWIAPLTGRLANTKHLLLLTACFFCAWKPWSLLYDPGFHLSYLAMIGLLTWSPWFSQKLKTWPAFLRQSVASSLGVTLVIAPYIAWAFQQSSLLGLITNLLATPLVPWIMSIGTFSLLFAWHGWPTLPINGLLSTLIWLAQLTDLVPTVLKQAKLPFIGFVLWELALVILWKHVHKNQKDQRTSDFSNTVDHKNK